MDGWMDGKKATCSLGHLCPLCGLVSTHHLSSQLLNCPRRAGSIFFIPIMEGLAPHLQALVPSSPLRFICSGSCLCKHYGRPTVYLAEKAMGTPFSHGKCSDITRGHVQVGPLSENFQKGSG